MKNEKLTYGKLEQVLRRLHFRRLENSPYRLYVNQAHDSVITLPNLADDKHVDPVHLSGVTTNLVYKGIVKDAATLERYWEGPTASTGRRPRVKAKQSRVGRSVLNDQDQS